MAASRRARQLLGTMVVLVAAVLPGVVVPAVLAVVLLVTGGFFGKVLRQWRCKPTWTVLP